jgi:hypothetical protein
MARSRSGAVPFAAIAIQAAAQPFRQLYQLEKTASSFAGLSLRRLVLVVRTEAGPVERLRAVSLRPLVATKDLAATDRMGQA